MACLGRQPGRGRCVSSNGGAGCGPGVVVANRLWNDGAWWDCISEKDIARNGIGCVCLELLQAEAEMRGNEAVVKAAPASFSHFQHGLIKKDQLPEVRVGLRNGCTIFSAL